MARFMRVAVMAASILALILGMSPLSTAQAAGNGSFKIFKAFRYNSMPSLSGCGLSDIRMLYPTELFGSGSRSQPNVSLLKNTVAKSLLKTNPKFVVIDIEHWDEIEEMDKLITVVRTLKQAVRDGGNTSMKFGFYMILPVRNCNAPTTGISSKLTAWKSQNDQLARLAKEVDVIFPSLYTIKNEPSNWVKYAKANIAEARQYGKPVYAFLWPQFHDYYKEYGTQYLPVTFWQLELETLQGLADGVAIWGSIKPNAASSNSVGWDTWDGDKAWWQYTKTFAQKNSVVAVSGCDD